MENIATSTLAPVEAISQFTASIFVNSELFVIEGDWKWEMQCNSISCSDVMLPADPEFVGTRGIFHPDDLTSVKNSLASLINGEETGFSFRMITSYGEIKAIRGEHTSIKKDEEEFSDDTNFSFLIKAFHEIELEKGFERSKQLRVMLDQFEKINDSGSWFQNSVTGETNYSDQLFRMYELMPGSLNAHAHTFLPFIFPEDKPVVEEAIERSFANKIPLHLEYRIITSSEKIKVVQHISEWIKNQKGEMTLIGMLRDNTLQHQQETAFTNANNDLHFHKTILQQQEKASAFGYWYMNLLTKQSYFSDNYYRIHGMKPQSKPASIGMIVNYVHPDDREKMQDALHKMRSLQVAPELDYRIIRPDGRVRYLSQKAKLIIYAGDELVMSAVIHDETESRQHQKKMHDRDEEIHIKNFITSQIEELAGIGSWVWDIESEAFDCSDHMCNMLGYKRKVELDFNRMMRAVHPDDRKKFLDEINVAIERKTESGFNFRLVTFGEVKYVKGFFKMLDYEERKMMIGTMQDISQEFSMQKQLHESLQVSQLLTENLLDAIYMTDTDNRIILWNKGSEQLFGISEDEAVGINFFDRFPEQRHDERISQFNLALGGQKIFKEEMRILPRHLHNMFMIPLKSQEETIIGILHVLQDVSVHSSLRNSLNERIGFIEKLLEQTVDRMIVLDKNLNYRFWNRKAEQHYHINSEYVTGKNILEVFPGIVDKPIYHELKKALQGHRIYVGNDPEDNSGEYEETYLVPLTNERNIVTGILWITHDLNKEVIPEQEDKSLAELQKQQNRFNEAQEISHIGSFEYHVPENKLYVSDEMYRIYGIEVNSEEMTIEKCRNMVHPEDVEFYEKKVEEILQSAVKENFIHRIVRRDGVVRRVNRILNSIADEAGKIVLVNGTIHDISEIYEKELAQKTAEALNQKKNNLIGVACHELKTPITILKTSLQLMEVSVSESAGPESINPLLASSLRQVNKLNQLVNELRDLAAIEGGKMKLHKNTFNFREVIGHCIEDLKQLLKGSKVEIDCPPELIIYADADRIEQVICNLFTNAVKYSNESADIYVRAGKEDGFTKFSITDKGIGISPDKQQNLFERYYRIEDISNKIKGQGLGLYIAKKIITKHGGEIGVESVEGKGSTFWFTLP